MSTTTERPGTTKATTVPNNAGCSNCRWWIARPARQNDTDNPRSGECHKAAPNSTTEGLAVWPTTLRSFVCGDWEGGS